MGTRSLLVHNTSVVGHSKPHSIVTDPALNVRAYRRKKKARQNGVSMILLCRNLVDTEIVDAPSKHIADRPHRT